MAAAPSLGELLRGRLAVVAALVTLTAASWIYLHVLTGHMEAGSGMTMPRMADMPGMVMSGAVRRWTPADVSLTLVMWIVMMVGMMLPSAAPMILTFAAVNRRRRLRGEQFVPTAVFTAGHLIVWSLFSLAATAAQWALATAALLSSMMGALSPVAAGVLFIAAGLYQVTPLKYACLKSCRSPFDFIINRWRDNASGALRMGMAHGIHCLGCCWMLMALMFTEGTMNLLWAAALAAFVFIEKLFPAGQWVARISGVLMLGFGVHLLMQT